MTHVMTRLCNEEAGFILSTELVLIASIVVLSMVVGLSEIAINVNNELEDVASAFGSVNQSFSVRGSRGHQGKGEGGGYNDSSDFCDGAGSIQSGSTQGEQ